MSSTHIYNETEFNNLLNQLQNHQQNTNTAILEQCRMLYDANSMLLSKHNGDTQSSKYKKDIQTVRLAARSSKTQYTSDVSVGQYLTNNPYNTDLLTLTKTQIYNQHIRKPKPKTVSKPKPAPIDTDKLMVDLQYYRECARKYEALMNYMGDKADSILSKALSQ